MKDAMLGDVIGVGAMELVYRMPHAATASMFGVLGMPPLQLRSSARVVSRDDDDASYFRAAARHGIAGWQQQ